MINDRVSIIIPARNERYLTATVQGLLDNAAGDVEVLVMLDGLFELLLDQAAKVGRNTKDPAVQDELRARARRDASEAERMLPKDRRVWAIRRAGEPGMRHCINEGAALATGRYLMKCDAHCIFDQHYDAKLKRDCEENWLAVPTRHSVNQETWTVKKRHFNYHYLTFPFSPSMYGYGLHGKTFDWDYNKIINAETAQVPIDDLMSFQGSCWFQHRENFLRLGPLDHANYYFYSESIEIGLRQWMTGGRCVINKHTWYAHLHKGRAEGRGFFLDLRGKRRSEKYNTDFWLNDRWPGATWTFVQFIEHFWPLLDRLQWQACPGDARCGVQAPHAPHQFGDRWPDDWRNFEKYRLEFEARPPEAIPAHI